MNEVFYIPDQFCSTFINFYILYQPIQYTHAFNGSLGKSLVLQEEGAEMLQVLSPSNFFFLQRHDHDMEVLIELNDLVEVLFLHLGPGCAHLASVLGKEDLVYYDVVDVDVELGQLLDQPLGLVHGQELGDAHCDKSSPCGVLHLLVDDPRRLLHALHLPEDFVQGGCQLLLRSEQRPHVLHYSSKLLLQSQKLPQSLLQDAGEVQESQSVSCGSSVEHHYLKVHFFYRAKEVTAEVLDELVEGHRLVDAWD